MDAPEDVSGRHKLDTPIASPASGAARVPRPADLAPIATSLGFPILEESADDVYVWSRIRCGSGSSPTRRASALAFRASVLQMGQSIRGARARLAQFRRADGRI